jgi:hypothetical protein
MTTSWPPSSAADDLDVQVAGEACAFGRVPALVHDDRRRVVLALGVRRPADAVAECAERRCGAGRGPGSAVAVQDDDAELRSGVLRYREHGRAVRHDRRLLRGRRERGGLGLVLDTAGDRLREQGEGEHDQHDQLDRGDQACDDGRGAPGADDRVG